MNYDSDYLLMRYPAPRSTAEMFLLKTSFFRCEWQIHADPGMGVHLRFIQFDLEREVNCDFDYVEIYDSNEQRDDRRVGRYCGDKVSGYFI